MLPVSRPSLPPLSAFSELLEDIWSSRMLSNFGKYARRLEEQAQSDLRNPFVRALVSGDVGLVLALASLGLPEGGECLVQSFTFNSTVNAILWNRLRPVFVDIDRVSERVAALGAQDREVLVCGDAVRQVLLEREARYGTEPRAVALRLLRALRHDPIGIAERKAAERRVDLGDLSVQAERLRDVVGLESVGPAELDPASELRVGRGDEPALRRGHPVSYTHLTLPTTPYV